MVVPISDNLEVAEVDLGADQDVGIGDVVNVLEVAEAEANGVYSAYV